MPVFAQERLTEAQFESIRLSKVVTAVRVTEPINFDGRLDERVWQIAEPATDERLDLQVAPTHQVSSNLRFNVTHHPLSDIYVVYNDRRDSTGGQLLERAFIVKVTNLFNF